MNADIIERCCLTFVPWVEVISDKYVQLKSLAQVEVNGVEQWVLFLCSDDGSWVGRIKGTDEEFPVDEIEDVIRVLWEAFGTVLYPAVLSQTIMGDASYATGAKIWNAARVVLQHEKGFIEAGDEHNARKAARFELATALAVRGVKVPTDLVLEAIAMTTSGAAMHHSWTRPTIKREDLEKVAP